MLVGGSISHSAFLGGHCGSILVLVFLGGLGVPSTSSGPAWRRVMALAVPQHFSTLKSFERKLRLPIAGGSRRRNQDKLFFIS
jgi:hypothetical protein